MLQNGFLGTDASFLADFSLIAEIVLFITLCIGVVAQRRGHFKWHDRIQTPVVVLNLALIIYLMLPSFLDQRVVSTLPQRPTDPYYLMVGIHAALGLVAEGLAIYCLLAGHKILPRHIGRLRYWMWATFGVWTLAVAFGVGTYYVWYMRPAETAVAAPQPQATVETEASNEAVPTTATPKTRVILQNFAFNPAELTVVAGTEITWLNQDGAPHNVTVVEKDVASDNFFQNESFSTTFEEPGVYLVYCTLHGSADGSGMAATVTVLENNEENAAVAAAPTPTIAATPAPTPAPTVAPPPEALLESETPQQIVVGLAAFFDETAPSDSVSVILHDIKPAEGGATLHAWLTDSGGGAPLSLGPAPPDENGRLVLSDTDPDHRNLLGLFDGFQLTEEPQFDDDPAPGPVVYSGRQAPEALAQIRAITVAAADTPDGKAYGLGARRQTEELLRHVEYVQTAYDLLSIADAQRHSEHIVNLLEGESGEFYGDLDGAHGVQNPGDGYGIIPYVTAMRQTAVQASQAPDATTAIATHAGHVELAADNALEWATIVRAAALEILGTDSVGDIGPQVATLVDASQRLLNGEDGNNDGAIAPDEGGIFTAYQHAQYMGAIPVVGDR